jgi:hypothetical protein
MSRQSVQHGIEQSHHILGWILHSLSNQYRRCKGNENELELITKLIQSTEKLTVPVPQANSFFVKFVDIAAPMLTRQALYAEGPQMIIQCFNNLSNKDGAAMNEWKECLVHLQISPDSDAAQNVYDGLVRKVFCMLYPMFL